MGDETGRILWVYSSPVETLDAATWLDTTRELRRLGWQVTLAVLGSPGSASSGGVAVTPISAPDKYLLRQVIYHLKIVRLMLRTWQQTDFVIFHQNSLPWLLPWKAWRMLRGQRRPLFIMDNRTVPMEDPVHSSLKDRLRNAFMVLNNRLANRWADGQTANTALMARAVGCPPEKLVGVWPAGVTLKPFVRERSNRLWPEGDEPVVLAYIGVINYERNLMRMARAVLEANAAGMNFRFLLVGAGTEWDDLQRLSQTVHGQITVSPVVPHDQIPRVLAGAHVGVLPFPDEEKFRVSSPIKLFEYMGAGLPLLVTRLPCHTDVIGAGKYAFWAESGRTEDLLKALQEIWARRAELPALGAAAAAAAEGHTWEASARLLSDALLRVQMRSLLPDAVQRRGEGA